jgi:AraC-like DNA-binding protein
MCANIAFNSSGQRPSVSQSVSISVRFHPPPQALRRYFTTLYVADIDVAAGETVHDTLQPEWANLRFFNGSRPDSWIDDDAHLVGTDFTVTGPSSRSTNFRLGTTRMWGIGLLPLGWARFIAKPAGELANMIGDGHSHPAFASFAPLAENLFGDEADEAQELARIIAFFEAFPARTVADEARILAIHAALINPQLVTVTELVKQVGTSQRTVERICHRHFGFSPKLLLRRQRFMRSLAQFMLDPSLKWIGAMDSTYHDQAQFVRDFHEFMSMTPREYAAMPHPILEKFIHERARVHGAAVQTLDSPDGSDASGDANRV